MDYGFFKICRKLTESDLWLSETFTRGQAWIDLINLAQFRPGNIRVRGVKVTVKRGQVGWSEVKIAARWRWSRGKLRRFLFELVKDERIEQQKNNVTSLITIVNYELYQPDSTADSTTDGQQTDSRQYPKERKKKKEKKEKKPNGKFIAPTLDEVVKYFAEKGYPSESGKKAFEYYSVADWKDSRGNQVKNWKQKMLANWMKDENRINQPGNNNSSGSAYRKKTKEEIYGT